MTESKEEARKAHRMGWNLRCNACGTYGALWVPNERPGWGSLAMCPECKADLDAEYRRHHNALRILRAVNFEQEPEGEGS